MKKEEFEGEITALKEDIEALHDLKREFPDIQFKIEQLKQIKIKEIKNLKTKIRAIDELTEYINN